MDVAIHPHAVERAAMRGATVDEIKETIRRGRGSPAKFGRTAFVLAFPGEWLWRNNSYATKQLEVIGVREADGWLANTVIVRFF